MNKFYLKLGKYIISNALVFILSFSTQVRGQNQAEVIDFSNYKNIKGVVFDKTIDETIVFEDLELRYTPNRIDVFSAELYLSNECKKRTIRICDRVKSKHWVRQYLGYINEEDQRVIVIQFLNFGTRKLRKFYSDWEKGFIVSSGEYFYKNSDLYIVNIDLVGHE